MYISLSLLLFEPEDVIIEQNILRNITLNTKPFSYATNMNYAEVRIEFTFKRHTYVNRGELS